MSRRLLFCTLLAGVLLALPSAAAQDATVVILVRHAEKVTPDPPDHDPALTAEGRARAQALVGALADAGVDAIVTSQWRRTRQTAAPLAAHLGLTPAVLSTDGAKDYPAAVAEAIRARYSGQTVVVVGHSNTVPQTVAALGGPSGLTICDAHYDDLFVVTLGRGGRAAGLVRARYGAPSPRAGPGCAP